nr:MAG TPA: hypothetical protein [Caudoviricetes sp.]
MLPCISARNRLYLHHAYYSFNNTFRCVALRVKNFTWLYAPLS